MRPGFPRQITTRKIRAGLYEITRDDGYRITVQKTGQIWVNRGSSVRRATLRAFQYDMRHGFTAHDALSDAREFDEKG